MILKDLINFSCSEVDLKDRQLLITDISAYLTATGITSLNYISTLNDNEIDYIFSHQKLVVPRRKFKMFIKVYAKIDEENFLKELKNFNLVIDKQTTQPGTVVMPQHSAGKDFRI